MYMKRMPILRMIAMFELVLGVWGLLQGGLSAYAVIIDMDGLLQMAAEMGTELSKFEIFCSLFVTLAGGIIMTAAGILGLLFGGKEGKEKPPIFCGYALFIYLIVGDAVSVLALGGQISLSMLLPFVIHAFYLWAAFRNKKDLEAVV